MPARQRGLAVVTGAAGGFGSAFANQLAERGYRLLLVDRRQGPLDQLCNSITDRHGLPAEPYLIDLTQRREVEKLASQLAETADMEVLVNNAGFGSIEYFVDSDSDYLMDMLDVHVAAPVMLTRAALPGMIDRNQGAIINVASVSAFLRSAGNVQYGSTKGFLVSFSLALDQELQGSKVRVQALCPGFVHTEFHDAIEMKGFTRKNTAGSMWMTADEVVACSLRRLSTRQVIVIPGLGYSVFCRLAQMPVLQPLMRWVTRVPRLPGELRPVVETCPDSALVPMDLSAANPVAPDVCANVTASLVNSPETAALLLAQSAAPLPDSFTLCSEDLENESRSRAGDKIQMAVGDNATALPPMSGLTAV